MHLSKLQQVWHQNERAWEARNREYVRRQVSKHASLFHHGQSYPLTARQVEAVLHDESRCLVVAGAGTGKTSTIVGKTAHILAEGLAKPDEILLLAFARKAADELEDRISALSMGSVKVKTFHALGIEAIAAATGKKPDVSRLADDDRAMNLAIQAFLGEIIADEGENGSTQQFLAFHRYPDREPQLFETQHQYHQYIAGQGVRSLKGEKLKSIEEATIANWLALHGIEYEYERPYEHDTASVEYRQYRPDFYLSSHGIYIEHFGINSKGEPPPFIRDPQRYLDGMRWKRDVHKRNGTTLVETFSHQAAAGTLLKVLARELAQRGVEARPLDAAGRRELFCQEAVLDPFAGLLTSFLRLYKGNGWTPDDVRARIADSGDDRAAHFLKIAEAVFARYESALRDEQAIDFNDMINEATSHAESGRYSPGYRYVLVDEFQDISRGRAMLLRALLRQVEDARLFCVGDDWQSIYRFTGSDIDLMTRFSTHFGCIRRTDLDRTHRFGTKLLAASSKFISANPQQLKKELVAGVEEALPAVEIISAEAERSKVETLEHALRRVQNDSRGTPASVLVLGRYHFCLDEYREVRPPHSGMELQFMTVHKAKGLEADYAIIVDVVGGRYGFPTEIADDPVLDLVLAQRGSFPNAEERRLFYVAMTRAKRKCFVLTQDVRRSVFVDELESDEYSGLVLPSGAVGRTVSCPECEGGRLQLRIGEWSEFWGCSNYPRCRARSRTCPWCGKSPLVKRGGRYDCASPECGRLAELCPECGVGALVPREGSFGPFLGCTEWRSEGASCDFTRSVPRE